MTGIGLAAIGVGVALIWAGIRDEKFSDLLSKTFGGAGSVPASAVGSPGLSGGGSDKREV